MRRVLPAPPQALAELMNDDEYLKWNEGPEHAVMQPPS